MDYNKEYQKWLSYDFLDKETKNELEKMKSNEETIKECFYDYLLFGTGGMRGIMGVGINRMNKYMIRRATQGFCNFLIKNNLDKKGVGVIYDCRINSKQFALETALTFCANGIKVYTFKSLRPTPFLSFVIRELNLAGGVNITASHNAKQYNGYKLYLSDGAQFSYPDDEKIINYVNEITDFSICKTMDEKEAIKKGLLNYIDGAIDKKFKENAKSKLINKDFVKRNGKNLNIVYTPLHGTGSFFLKDAMKEVGFTKVNIVKSQDDKNGEFKTVAYPNPESSLAFSEAIKLAKQKNADIIIATDPDADRLGVYVKVKNNEYKPLTGNELGSIVLEYILYFAKQNKLDFNSSYCAKSFVTTRMIDAITKNYNVDLSTTLTGFKWIGKEILNNKKHFIFGLEESYGFLISDYVRDKDAIAATLVVLEIALAFKQFTSKNLIDVLDMLRAKYGYYKNYNKNFDFPGVSGLAEMKNIMENIRKNPIHKLTDIDVEVICDYLTSTKTILKTNTTEKLTLPKNDSIVMNLADNSTITIRPSGTEPKVKLYYDIVDVSSELSDNKFEILNQAMTKIITGGGN